MRVGELSRRTGVGVSTLRAWEARFGFLTPERSPAGHRLYADDDVERVHAVLRLVAEGLTLPAAIARVSCAGLAALPEGQGEALLYGQVLQAVAQGVWVMRDGRSRYANRRMADLMGCSLDELLRTPVDELFGPIPVGESRARRAALRQGKTLRFRNTVGRADGTRFLAEIDMAPLFDHAGGYQGAVALVNDITERAEEERQARFRTALLDSIGEAVVAADPEGRIAYVNAAAERLFGLRGSDVVGKDGRSVLAAPWVAVEADRIHARLVGGNRYVGELTLVRGDGSEFAAHFVGAPALGDDGSLIGLTAVITDRTERVRREQERRALDAQLETLCLLGQRVLGDGIGRDGILAEAAAATRRLLEADQVTVFVAAPDDALTAVAGSPAIDEPTSVPGGGRSFAGYIALARTVVVVDDASTDLRFEAISARQGLRTVSAIGAPILDAGGIRGVLTVESAARLKFDRSATHFVQGIANTIGAVLAT